MAHGPSTKIGPHENFLLHGIIHSHLNFMGNGELKDNTVNHIHNEIENEWANHVRWYC